MANLQRVDPLYEQVYRILDEAIILGKLLPGERIIESKIALEYGVSRSPVREAIRILEQEGLIVNDSGVLKVFKPTMDDVVELYKLRIALEPIACYWACENVDNNFLEKLDCILHKTMKALKSNDINSVVEYNSIFHGYIIEQSSNKRLQQILFNIRKLTKFCRNTVLKKSDRSENFLEEHFEIFDTLKNKESALSHKTMKKHLINDYYSIVQIEDFKDENNEILNDMERWLNDFKCTN